MPGGLEEFFGRWTGGDIHTRSFPGFARFTIREVACGEIGDVGGADGGLTPEGFGECREIPGFVNWTWGGGDAPGRSGCVEAARAMAVLCDEF